MYKFYSYHKILRGPFLIIFALGILFVHAGFAEIIPTPANPNVEEHVRFAIVPPGTDSYVDWDFGDGSRLRGSWVTNHTYTRAGTFTVRASYAPGAVVIVQTKVITVQERRRVTFTPSNPQANAAAIIQAVNFLDTRVRWDFGDGTQYIGKKTEQHVYKQPGRYTVSAVDLNGTSLYRFTANIVVSKQAQVAIAFNPEKPRKGEAVSFSAINFQSHDRIRWDFGDGTVLNDNSPPSITHVYNSPGRYRVRAYDGGGNTVTASVSVRVFGAASIDYAPNNPHTDEPVSFTAVNFFSTSVIRWDFGDGTVTNDTSPPFINHIYRTSGTYLVRAFDNAGATQTASTTISVKAAREIHFTPQNPGVDEPIQFQALNFDSDSIRWDFGDGTILPQSGRNVSHTYVREGVYVVTAFDFNGMIQIPIPTSLTVTPVRGPRAPFSISYIQLRFEDGKAYTVIPKGFLDLKAFIDLKYEGTGVFSAYWMVDGAAFQPLSISLPFADQATLSTAQEVGQVGLPTLLPGLHEVTLRIINPQTDYTIPVISYYVSPDESERRLLIISGLNVEGLGEEDAEIAGKTIKAPVNEHFLLRGLIRNTSVRQISRALLRIYLDEELIDQQLLEDLTADEERQFSSSILLGTDGPRKLYITLYDISQPSAVLQYLLELNVIPIED